MNVCTLVNPEAEEEPEEADPVMTDFGDMLQAIFGEDNVFVGDEHGIRPLNKKKMV